jgi:parallel beta-helix repeat protein
MENIITKKNMISQSYPGNEKQPDDFITRLQLDQILNNRLNNQSFHENISKPLDSVKCADYIVYYEGTNVVGFNSTTGKKIAIDTDTSVVINAILAEATNTVKIHFKKGTFWFSSNINISNCLIFEGEGIGVTILELSPSANCDMFSYNTAVNIYFVTFKHLTASGNRAHNTSGSFLKTNEYVNDIFIFDCFIEEFSEYGCDLGTQWGLRIMNSVFEFMTLDAIKINSGANGSISCTKIISNDGNGIVLTGGSGACQITGCYIGSNGNHGIYINNHDYNAIVGNRISFNNRITTTGSDIEIDGGSVGNLIVGNYISGDSRSIYNIKLASASATNIQSNTLTGAVTNAIYMTNGYHSLIRNNKGWISENWDTKATVADGGTIAHGLAHTPAFAVVVPSVSGEVISITTIDATNLTVAIKKISDGSAGTTQTVYWYATSHWWFP